MAGLAKHPPVYLPEVSALLGLLHIMFGIKESGIAVADPEQYLYFGYPFFSLHGKSAGTSIPCRKRQSRSFAARPHSLLT